MKYILSFFIFCIVLFLYLHVQYHLKTSNDLEVYECENPTKEKLEEICDIRQPFLFNFDSNILINKTNRKYIYDNYSAFEIKIRNNIDTLKFDKNNNNNEIYIPLKFSVANKLFNHVTETNKETCTELSRENIQSNYFTENNIDFLNETGVIKNFHYNDDFLRPFIVSNCDYDIMIGGNNSTTPLRYFVNYRNYLLVTSGNIKVKLFPPNSSKYLSTNYDYEYFEFSSPINVWNPQEKYLSNFEKIKCLEFTIKEGQTLYIPAYWWYSIKFQDNSSVSCFYYKTYMNNIAITPYYILYFLQILNVKRDTIKKLDIEELNNKLNLQPNMQPNMQQNQQPNMQQNQQPNMQQNQQPNMQQNQQSNMQQNQQPNMQQNQQSNMQQIQQSNMQQQPNILPNPIQDKIKGFYNL